MRWKTTAGLLIATVGIGTYISLYEQRQPTPEGRARQAKVLLSIPPEDVTQLAITQPLGALTFARLAPGWRMSPGDYRADTDVVEAFLSRVRRLSAERLLLPAKDQPLDLKTYGLDPALITLTLTTATATSTLLLGEPTAVGGNRYAKIADQPAVGIITSQLFDELNKPVEDFRDRRLVRLESWNVQQAEWRSASATFSLVREDTAWRLIAPFEDRADSVEVTTWLNKAVFLRSQRFLPALLEGAPDPAGFDKPEATLVLQPKEAAGPALTLTFGKPLAEDATLRYAQRSDEPHRYAVAVADVEALLRDPHGLRSTLCFDAISPSQVAKIEILHEGATQTWEQKDGAWVSAAGEPVPDKTPVEQWLGQVTEARFSGFVEEDMKALNRYGLNPPEGRVSLWRQGEETPQQLLVGKLIKGTTNRYAQAADRPAVVRIPEDVAALLKPTWIQ
jgi:hypothetical protein